MTTEPTTTATEPQQAGRGDWIVMCQVSGGATGFRQAPLKRDGAIRYFATKAEAGEVAQGLERQMNSPYACAFFVYWPERVQALEALEGLGRLCR